MKPKSLHLRNFKGVGNNTQSIDLSPITLLFGANSAGKSTILQALIYLREVLVGRNYDPDKTTLGGDWLDLGGFRNLVHKRNLEEAIFISVTFEIEDGEEVPDYLSQHEREQMESASLEMGTSFLPDEYLDAVAELSIGVTIRWSDILSTPFVEFIDITINGKRFCRLVGKSDQRQVYFEKLNFSHPLFCSISGDEEHDLRQRIAQVFRPSIADREVYGSGLTELLNEERPYRDRSLEELAELIEGGAYKKHPELAKILLAEVSVRRSRWATELRQRLMEEIGQGIDKSEQELVYIGVQEQGDALPDPSLGIRLDSSVWVDKDDWQTEYGDSNNTGEVIFSSTKLLAESLVSSLVAGSVGLLREWVDEIHYIGPLRNLPPRNLQPHLTPDRSRWATGLAAWELIHSASESTIKEINYWLGEGCLKTGYQLDVHQYRELPIDDPSLMFLDREMEMDDQLLLKDAINSLPIRTRAALIEEETGLTVMPQDVGVGISQVLPVVVLAISQKTGVIAIEQPELHVHPAIQVELADLFARYAIQHNKLFLLETHSEHLLLRLLRRIRGTTAPNESDQPERGLKKEDVSVQYVQPSPEGTRFKRLRIDSDGDFEDEWPDGFFDERDEELF